MLQSDQFKDVAERSLAIKRNQNGLFNGRAASDRGQGTGRAWWADWGQGTGRNVDADATSDWVQTRFVGGE